MQHLTARRNLFGATHRLFPMQGMVSHPTHAHEIPRPCWRVSWVVMRLFCCDVCAVAVECCSWMDFGCVNHPPAHRTVSLHPLRLFRLLGLVCSHCPHSSVRYARLNSGFLPTIMSQNYSIFLSPVNFDKINLSQFHHINSYTETCTA